MSEIRLSNMPTMTVGQLTQQLAVQHPAVGDDDNGLEDLLVPGVMQPRQAMRQPGNGVGLARARAVLDEVVAPGAVSPHVLQQLGHHVQLVIPGEDHPLGLYRAGLFVLLHLQVEVLVQNLQQAVLAKHLLPQVGGVVAVGVVGVALAAHVACAVAALVEGQKVRALAFQPGGHVHLGEVHGKVHQHAVFEGEDGVPAGAVKLVLLHGVSHALAGELAFELHGHHGNAVEEEHNIHAVFVDRGIVQLAGAVQDIGGILGLAEGVHGGFRLPEHGVELDAPVGKALAQHLQKPHQPDLPAEALDELALAVRAIDAGVALPLLGLAGADEGKERAGIQRAFPVKGGGVALLVAAMGQEGCFDVLFEALFSCIEVGHGCTS